jgi:hypothetical protein
MTSAVTTAEQIMHPGAQCVAEHESLAATSS